jgi:sorting nexin-17
MKEYSFRVTRIRCWRLTTSLQDKLNGCANTGNSSSSSFQNNGTTNMRFELSFEYLLSKDHLQWITIISDQVFYITIYYKNYISIINSKLGNFNECLPARNG